MLKCKLLLVLLITLLGHAGAQIPSPVKWSYEVKQEGNVATLQFKAFIKTTYHVYSQNNDPDAGPIPTSFTFQPGKEFELDGKVLEGKSIEIFDPNFGVKLRYFSDEAVFTQQIKVKENKPFTVSGVVTFMVCDDTRCYPPEDVSFSFALNETTGQAK